MVFSLNNYTTADMLTLSWEMMVKEWRDTSGGSTASNFLLDFLISLKLRNQSTLNDFYAVCLLAFLFTIHRYVLIHIVLKPLTKYFNFSSKDTAKFKESGCRLSCYSLFYAISYYLVHYKYPQYQHNLTSHWVGWYQEMEVPDDIRLLNMLESGYYLYAIYATYYLDVWKKDSVAMIMHHVLANSLIVFSMSIRYYSIGLLVMYLHDGADVIFEATKLILCFKRNSQSKLVEYSSNIGFVLFTTNWFWCRLVRYPQLVLFSGLYVGRSIIPDQKEATFYFFFNAMLLFLLFLNVWWFHFIVMLLLRLVTGQAKEVEDTREYHPVSGSESNGSSKTNGHAPEEQNINLKTKDD